MTMSLNPYFNLHFKGEDQSTEKVKGHTARKSLGQKRSLVNLWFQSPSPALPYLKDFMTSTIILAHMQTTAEMYTVKTGLKHKPGEEPSHPHPRLIFKYGEAKMVTQ